MNDAGKRDGPPVLSGWSLWEWTMAGMMAIQLNGERRMCPENGTVESLLEELGLKREQVAVEVNLAIIPREEFATFQLHEGDCIEVMSFMGGGAYER